MTQNIKDKGNYIDTHHSKELQRYFSPQIFSIPFVMFFFFTLESAFILVSPDSELGTKD